MKGGYARSTNGWTAGLALLAVLALPCSAGAGLHYSAEKYAPLPARWSGFLQDQRALRTIAQERPRDGLVSPLRQQYLQAAEHYHRLSRHRSLTADEVADYGAVLIRLGRLTEALGVLEAGVRRWPDHFAVQANRGTAWQLAGDLNRAADALHEAVRLAPAAWKRPEQFHLKLVRLRQSEKKGTVTVDDLFGVRLDGPAGPWSDDRRRELPEDAAALVQQLALWLPQDGRLLWLAAELANAYGDVPMAAAMLDGCVTEFGLASATLQARRQLFREAAAQLRLHARHVSYLRPRSSRPLLQAFDERLLPPPRTDGPTPLPWPLLQAATPQPDGTRRFPDYLLRLDGQIVSLQGFIQPMGDSPQLHEFLLLPYPVGCWFCDTPEPTGMVYVRLSGERPAEYRRLLVLVTGRLRLNRDNPETFLYMLEEAVVALPQ